jgi:DNA-directed RNA polymerase specialized sigma24 family protein
MSNYIPPQSVDEFITRDYLSYHLSLLTPAQSHCIIAYFIWGQSIDEIAKECGQHPWSVEIALDYGWENLQQNMNVA